MQNLPSYFAKEIGDEIAPYVTLRDPKIMSLQYKS